MTKKTKIILFIGAVLLWSCQTEVTESNDAEQTDTDTIINVVNDADIQTETGDLLNQMKMYKGSWFDIEYPTSFTAIPTEPIIDKNEISYVETDEAFFQSPDQEVEFFVYSPQWGGEPSYFKLANNELIESEKEAVDEIVPTTIITWVTIKDKNENYWRSYYHKKTNSTDLVFGIWFTSQSAYERYKPQYTAFKKSLVQYAD